MKSKSRIKKSPNRIIKRLDQISATMRKKGSVVVGLPSNSNDYPDGTSTVKVGAVHEFGSPSKGIPQRSFLRSTLIENRSKYKKIMVKLAKSVVKGEIDKEIALSKLGLIVETDIKSKITDLKEPSLKVREGGNPLVDTGHLRRSIIHKVI